MTTIDRTRGAARERVAPEDATALRRAGVLAEDARRERPRWFDGRFLAARDLIREQQYFLTREADLGRAAGSGVASGLEVREGAGPQTLSIAAGHGITPAGELVMLPRRLEVALANLAAVEQMSARFGLARLPQPPLRSRSGVFALALRPVEYTANPIGAYPNSITGQRSVEDGDIVEATAVVLVPWPDDGAGSRTDAEEALDAWRGRIARDVFVASRPGAARADVLPIALVALQNNSLVWIDQALVRRELGADRGDLPGLGFSPRALRLAHLVQYQDHLADLLQARRSARFAAAEHFAALPGAGPLPPGVIDPRDFTQRFFPAEVDVDFSLVPEDELPALVEDALLLQPIDLEAPADSLDSTAVMIVAPVPRHEWRAVVARLASTVRTLKPAAPNLLAQRRPFEVLQRLRLPRLAPVPDATSPSDAEWQRLARLPSLWFVRRRQLALRDDFTGTWQAVAGVDERAVEGGVRERLGRLGLAPQFDRLVGNASPAAVNTLTQLLAAPRFTESPALTAAALGSLAEAVRAAGGEEADPPSPNGGETPPEAPAVTRIPNAEVLRVAAELAAPGAGIGIERLERAAGAQAPLGADALQRLASGTEWRRLDAAAGSASASEVLRIAATSLRIGGGTPGPAPVRPGGPRSRSAAAGAATVAAAGAGPAGTEPIASQPAEPPLQPTAGSPERASTVVSPRFTDAPAGDGSVDGEPPAEAPGDATHEPPGEGGAERPSSGSAGARPPSPARSGRRPKPGGRK